MAHPYRCGVWVDTGWLGFFDDGGKMTTTKFRLLSELEEIALAAVERGEWDHMGSSNDEATAFERTFSPGEVLRLVRSYRASIRASMILVSADQIEGREGLQGWMDEMDERYGPVDPEIMKQARADFDAAASSINQEKDNA